ncbi:cora-domain-containing protein [Macrolepiota fuliginosa MF-IS2]|uniref:Cora-domain-containing protein n=1 Tax=Macrolepiota fuliginosa MF-IS2 TaxID=1400762 RepID=A0A9P5XK04_9AGAR|nr:cora-domain-containing protein [Macrolepiota fuliginosa MF-IS2]
MTSPPHDTVVLSSSPISIRGGSPTRRRSGSPDDLSDITSRARHSPTRARSIDPNEVRERQRTMDVDMAMQLSRARRETLHISSPVAPYESTLPHLQPSPEHVFPSISVLSPHAEHDTEAIPDMVAGDTVDEDTLAPLRQPSITNLQHIHQAHDPNLLVSLAQSTSPNGNEEPSVSNFGLPTYQANISRSTFDFSKMEEFAVEEKQRLGLTSPTAVRPSASFIRGKAVATEVSPPIPGQDGQQEEGLPDSGSQRALRHRKLSTSNPNPRIHRKGIGGKMALFENNSGEPPASLSARLGFVLSGHPSESYDNMPGPSGLPPTGILNTGHDRPYRFSFYSNALSATIHARSLSELPAEGQTFEELFSGINNSDGTASDPRNDRPRNLVFTPPDPINRSSPIHMGLGNHQGAPPPNFTEATSSTNGNPNRRSFGVDSKMGQPAGDNDTDSNTWWLDVQNPTDEEMKMLSKVFSIHPLTTEDILMEETREKIELFRNYYLVCFRSFDQDPYSPTHLEPLNMYIIVFREGILSFHFRPTPHPQNVRRRIKQLKDYISVTSDWISYALIDDITDAFGPLIQSIEYEVDSIDELVLILKEAEQSDMLRRIGTCRKKVMGLLRLMGNKADVVKGLAKRCNENWRVAPTSDIGLYLSDIQDHLITMTQNLNHYEKILSRSHSNYLAQISIEMTDANNQINDVLSKLTALGTVLIPMNLITGLWGMNVHVPGQNVEEVGLPSWFR